MNNELASPAQEKRDAFANHVRSEQRKRIFHQQRKRLEDAQKRGDEEEMELAQS